MSRVMVRVTELVAFFATRPVIEVFDFVFLPVILSLTYVPRRAAKVPVIAVMMPFHIFFISPGLAFSFASFFAYSSSAAAAA